MPCKLQACIYIYMHTTVLCIFLLHSPLRVIRIYLYPHVYVHVSLHYTLRLDMTLDFKRVLNFLGL